MEKTVITYPENDRRALPSAIDEEKGLLCSMMVAPEKVIPRVVELKLLPEAFHHPAHATVYKAVTGMWTERLPVDLISVTSRLEDLAELENVGGAGGVTELFTFTPTAANWQYYADRVKEKWSARQAILIAKELTEAAYTPSLCAELPRMAQEALVKMAGLYESKAETVMLKDIILETLNHLEDVMNGRAAPGLLTGIDGLDKAMRGMKPGQMIVIAAQTKRGKTTLALQIGQNVASDNHSVGIFSLEMSRLELGKKLLTAKSMVDLSAASERPLNTGEWKSVLNSAARLSDLKISVRDESVVTPFEFQSAARKLVAEQKCKLLIVDYLQLFTPDSESNSREREVAKSSRIIKTLASDLGIPIIVLSQLNELDRSRESRAIENDANIFMIIEEVPETITQGNKEVALKDDNGNDIVNHWLWIKYGRDIGSCRIPVNFNKKHGVFSDKYVAGAGKDGQ